MATNQVSKYLKFANLQMAAESLFRLGEPGDIAAGAKASSNGMDSDSLFKGNNRVSTFSKPLASKFLLDWDVVEHQANTASGFSGTLFKAKRDNAAMGIKTGELVLSFRSTEFADDYVRDQRATNQLEIRKHGYAFGQIADMEKWYADLLADGKLNDEKGNRLKVAVTGYSLGGHLATAFNQLRFEDGTRDAVISETYTFNGAGVGRTTNGQSLTSAIQAFKDYRDGMGPLTTDQGQKLYRFLKGDESAAQGPYGQIQFDPNNWEVKLLYQAKARLDQILADIGETAKIPNGNKGPANIVGEKIAATSLDYHIGVLMAARMTEAVGVETLENLDAAYSTSRNLTNPSFSNFFDIYGAAKPSAVANSQLHAGLPTAVQIEDQPLYRGATAVKMVGAGLVPGETKVLFSNFGLNDFGDTHSLVLLVDSLYVQHSLAQLDPTLSASTIEKIFVEASNKRRSETSMTQGQSEGDVLENIVNQLVDATGVAGIAGNRLRGNTAGNTWWEIGDQQVGNTTYSGRESLHKRLAELADGFVQAGIVGKFQIKDSSGALGLARSDFGSIAALLAGSTFMLVARPGEESAVAAYWREKSALNVEFAAWQQDNLLTDSQRDEGKAFFSNEWLDDRARYVAAKADSNRANTPRVIGKESVTFEDAVEGKLTVVARSTDVVEPNRKIAFGGKGKDSLEGSSGNDSLYGGASDDVLTGGQGRDHLEGGVGVDEYKFSIGDGKDTIIDVDGQGGLYINGRQPFLRGIKNPDNKTGQAWVDEAAGLEFIFKPSSSNPNIGTLEIRQYNKSSTSLGKSDSITIKGFDLSKAEYSKANANGNQNYLNIRLATDKIIQVTPDTTVPPIVDPDGTPPEFRRTSFNEGGSTLVNVSLNSPMEAGQKLRFKLSETLTALGAGWKLMVNGTAMAFNGGELIVDAPAGKSQQLFTLVSSNEQPNDVAGKVEVTLLGADGNPVTNEGGSAVASELGLDIKALQDEDTSLPAELEVQNAGEANHIIGTDAAESIDGGAGADLIEARDGNDLILNAGDGRDKVLGEAGNDRLVAGNFMPVNWRGHAGLLDDQQDNPARAAFLDGGEGNDRLLGEGGDDLLAGGAGEDLLLGGAGSDLLVGDNLVAGKDGAGWGMSGRDITSLASVASLVSNFTVMSKTITSSRMPTTPVNESWILEAA